MADYVGNLQIGGTNRSKYRLLAWNVEASEAKRIEQVQTLGGRYPAYVELGFNGPLRLRPEVLVLGGSVAELQANLRALRAEAAMPTNTWLHDRGDGTLTAFRLLESGRVSPSEDPDARHALQQRVVLELAAEPFGTGALQVVHDAVTVATPAALSLKALRGDLPSELRVRCEDASSNGIHSLWGHLAPRSLEQDMWLLRADQAFTWSGGDLATVANSYSTQVRRNSSTTAATGTKDTAVYPPGKYRVLARVRVAAGYGYVKTNLAGADEQVTVTRTSWHLVELGTVWLPPKATHVGTSADLVVSLTGDGSNYCYLDYLLLLPTWLGGFRYHPTSASEECESVDVGPAGVFIDGVGDWSHVRGDVLRPRITESLIPELVTTHSPDGSTWPSDWTRNDESDVTASGGKFQIVSDVGVRNARVGPFVVTPWVWYEVELSKQVTAFSTADAMVVFRWYDVAGELLNTDTLAAWSATDAAPVTGLAFHAQAPDTATYLRAYIETEGGAGTTVQFWDVYVHRCPLQIILVSEDADGSAGTQDLAVTVSATPAYEAVR